MKKSDRRHEDLGRRERGAGEDPVVVPQKCSCPKSK